MGDRVSINDASVGDDVIVEVHDGVGLVRLNRPDRGNSVTPAVVSRMGEAVHELAARHDVGAVVLTGTGRVFCAGADVKEMFEIHQGQGPDGLMAYLAETWMPAVQHTVRLLWSAPVPVVAAYNGAATAGGLDFGLVCDVRVAVPTAKFAESYVNLGMVPVAGGAFLLQTLVGPAAAARMIASGMFVSAAEALEMGMISEVCDEGALLERALGIAREMMRGPKATYARAKQIARAAADRDLDAALTESLAANIDLLARPEVRGAVMDVMERYSSMRGGDA